VPVAGRPVAATGAGLNRGPVTPRETRRAPPATTLHVHRAIAVGYLVSKQSRMQSHGQQKSWFTERKDVRRYKSTCSNSRVNL
jgi:hypothetical protein